MFARATVWSTWIGRSQVNAPSSSDAAGSPLGAPDPPSEATGVADGEAGDDWSSDGDEEDPEQALMAMARSAMTMSPRRWCMTEMTPLPIGGAIVATAPQTRRPGTALRGLS